MKNSNELRPVSFKEIESLTNFSLITFDGDCLSWNQGLWTVSRVSEKAILIDGEWLPKSQIVDVSMVSRRKYDADGSFETVVVPELHISSWFDKMNNKKRPKGYGW